MSVFATKILPTEKKKGQIKKPNVNNHCISGDATLITTAVEYFLKRQQC